MNLVKNLRIKYILFMVVDINKIKVLISPTWLIDKIDEVNIFFMVYKSSIILNIFVCNI
jgi:hypothetical protein